MGMKIERSSRVVDVLIVARPSRFRNGLKAIVQALTWVQRVGMVDRWTAVSDYVQRYHPAIIIFDIEDLDPITWVDSEILRRGCQNTKSIAIIDRAQQRDIARTLEVDAILLRGFTTDLLYHTMRMMVIAYDPAVPVTGPLNDSRL